MKVETNLKPSLMVFLFFTVVIIVICTCITIVSIFHTTGFVHKMNYAIDTDRIQTFMDPGNLMKGERKGKTQSLKGRCITRWLLQID